MRKKIIALSDYQQATQEDVLKEIDIVMMKLQSDKGIKREQHNESKESETSKELTGKLSVKSVSVVFKNVCQLS